MKKLFISILFISFASEILSQRQEVYVPTYKMEELTAPQFNRAVEISRGVCIIPIGILEKHASHLPIGSDLIEARAIAFKGAEKEYAVVFPPYFQGQVFVAKAQPACIAYSSDLIWKLLDETCMELSRNGLKKIILYNGHGGNKLFLQYFCQSQLNIRRDYQVVLFQSGDDIVRDKEIDSLKETTVDGHAGEEETSMVYYINPALVDKDRATDESGADLNRLAEMKYGFTGMYWYAKFPNHYAGDGAHFSKNLGELIIEKESDQLAELIRYLKNHDTLALLQEEFYKKAESSVK